MANTEKMENVTKKKKIHKLQIFRIIIQVAFLVLLPELFALTFGELKQIYSMFISGNFNFIQVLPSLIEVIVVITATILLGRFFCGWACAFGTLNDLLYLIPRKIFKFKGSYKVNRKMDSILKYFKYVVLIFIIVFIWTKGSTAFESASPWDAFAQITNLPDAISNYFLGVVLLVLISIGAMFIERFFCRYLCPLGAVLSIASAHKFFKIDKPRKLCGKCRSCTNACSMGIELYKNDKADNGECINCFKCVEVCPRKNVSASIGNQKLNPAFASTLAISGFIGLFAINFFGLLGTGTSNGSSSVSTSNKNSQTQSNSKSSTNIATLQGNYKDGTYTGTGNGFRPGLQVSVTIKNNKITSVEVLSNNETPRYSSQPISVVPQEIVQAQSTSVHAISGATRTSDGIIMAVQNALSKAQTSVN